MLPNISKDSSFFPEKNYLNVFLEISVLKKSVICVKTAKALPYSGMNSPRIYPRDGVLKELKTILQF